jgi:hypothetical protein
MEFQETVAADVNAPGLISVKRGSVASLALWAYSIESVSDNATGPGSKIQLKSTTWFLVDASVDAVVSAVGTAMQLWVREERNLKSIKAA